MDHMPKRAGAGFKAGHFPAILETAPDIGFFEVHAENYMGAGGPPHAQLSKIREDYGLSIHGVGLSIGGAGDLNADHLDRLKVLCDRYEPELFSEHLAWSTHTAGYYNDLLAVPYTDETLSTVVDHIDRVQTTLHRQMLLENPSTYIRFDESTWDEVDFIAEVAKRSGCCLLLDVNNVYVSAVNHGWDAHDYLARFPLNRVQEIHLAGHLETTDDTGARLLVDAHNGIAIDPVIDLFEQVLEVTGPLPSLIEWDNDVPDWPVLFDEVTRIETILSKYAAADRHVA